MFSFVYIAQKVKTTIKNYYPIWSVTIMQTFLVCTWYSTCISCIHNCWGIKFYFAHQTKSLFTWRWDISDTSRYLTLLRQLCPGFTWKLMVFNKNFVLSVFSILSLVNGFFSCILCVFTVGICNFHHVDFHVRILVMCITVEVVLAHRDIPVQSVHMDNWVVQVRYLGPPSFPGFMWTYKLSKQRHTCTLGYLRGPRYPCLPRYLASCEQALRHFFSFQCI